MHIAVCTRDSILVLRVDVDLHKVGYLAAKATEPMQRSNQMMLHGWLRRDAKLEQRLLELVHAVQRRNNEKIEDTQPHALY